MRQESEAKSAVLKITNQFRSKGGMAYDLKCDGVRLTLLVTPRSRSEDPGEWCVEARGGRSLEHMAVLSEWGVTRAEALRAVGKSWMDALDTQDLRVFDWDAVANILSSVRAI